MGRAIHYLRKPLRFLKTIMEHCNDNTKPYAGVVELIETLKEKGYAVAIVSNKIDFAVKELNDLYFKGIVPVAIGEKEGIRRKPAPDTVFEALKELGKNEGRRGLRW